MTALDRLSQIVPPDIALANKALSVSMLQITGIASMKLPAFANTVYNIQTTYGLPLITNATSAVPPNSANAIVGKLGVGTSDNGTITISDAMGTIAGVVSANALANTIEITSTMNLSNLSNIYISMTATANGSYGDITTGPIVIPSGPASGTYDNLNAAFSGQEISGNAGGVGLIPATTSNVIPTIVSAYLTQTANLNANWSNMATQINLEKSIQASADIVFANLMPNSTSSIFSFVFSLPTYGKDTTVGGASQFLEAVADKTTIGGEAIIATLRQGQSNISSSAIKPSINVPANPNPPPAQATLLPAQPPYPPPTTT